MEAENWPIDFSFTYPVDCTREQLRKILTALSLHWPGWEHYPWRITRNIHRLIDTPSVNFHYLLVQHCVASHAAHVVLKGKFADRNDVLDMMIREKFQFVGVFRLMLIDALRYEMRFTKLTYIRDCTGRDDGHTSVTEEELMERRGRYRDTIEGAENDLVRILNIASVAENMEEWLNGHPLRVWARGGDVPAPVMLQVRSEYRDGKKVLWPAKQEAAAMVRAGKTVPCLELTAKTASSFGGATEGNSAVGDKVAAFAKTSVAAQRAMADQTEDKSARRCGDRDDDEDASRVLAFRAIDLATRLDSGLAKKPTHATVLGMYCGKNLSMRAIAKACGCAHTTVANRKQELERKLGLPLDAYRQHSGMLEKATKAAEDARAKKIYRRGLME